MKNMFLVINKEKVYAYVVSIFTIITLFFLSQVLNSNLATTEETGAHVEQITNTQVMENNSNEQV